VLNSLPLLTDISLKDDPIRGSVSLLEASVSITTITHFHLERMDDDFMLPTLKGLRTNGAVKTLFLDLLSCTNEETFQMLEELLKTNTTIQEFTYQGDHTRDDNQADARPFISA